MLQHGALTLIPTASQKSFHVSPGMLHVRGARPVLCNLLQLQSDTHSFDASCFLPTLIPFLSLHSSDLQFCVDCCDNLCMGVREAFRVFMVGATMLIIALVFYRIFQLSTTHLNPLTVMQPDVQFMMLFVVGSSFRTRKSSTQVRKTHQRHTVSDASFILQRHDSCALGSF